MNQLQEELLSAYLDGELSAGEKADVERWLADDTSAGQLLDELRALSSAVRGLPTYRLGEGFSSQVLRAAERRMLSGDPPANPDRVPVESSSWRPTIRRILRPRNLLWPAIAVAVAILLTVFNPPPANHGGGQPGGGEELAINPQDGPAVIRLAPENSQDAGAEEKQWRASKHLDGPTIAEKSNSASPSLSPSGENGTAEGLLVVRCRITSAASQKAFDQLLAQEQIKGRYSNDPTGALRRMVGEGGDTLKLSTAQGPEPVFVQAEATPAQIDAIVAQMKAHPERFSAMTLKQQGPEPKPGQAGKREVLFMLEIVK